MTIRKLLLFVLNIVMISAVYAGGSCPTHSVPEPSTMLLLGAGIAGVVGYKKYKKHKDDK